MSDNIGQSISINAFAKELGVDGQAIRLAIQTGRIRSAVRWGRGWTITDAAKARQEWVENTRPAVGKGPKTPAPTNGNGHEPPPPATLAAATLRERLARAKLLELDHDKRRRELIPLREAEQAEAARIVAARTKILGVPSRYKQRAPHATVSDLGILDALLREALEELAAEAPLAVELDVATTA